MPPDHPAPDAATNIARFPAAAVEFDVANRLFFRLYQCSNLMHKNGTRYMTGFGSTTQQWAVLGALARPLVREKGMTVKELIAFLLLSRQNLTAVIDRLEAREWIERVRDQVDKRSRRIRLTEEGERTWAQMLSAIETFYTAALKDLTHSDQVLLCQMLDRLKTTLSKV